MFTYLILKSVEYRFPLNIISDVSFTGLAHLDCSYPIHRAYRGRDAPLTPLSPPASRGKNFDRSAA